jgi:hypothetical protein
MEQQTAVEWLQEQLECFGNKHELQMSWTTLDELFDQAKEMEKKRLEQFYNFGLTDVFNYSFEKNYEETFKNK